MTPYANLPRPIRLRRLLYFPNDRSVAAHVAIQGPAHWLGRLYTRRTTEDQYTEALSLPANRSIESLAAREDCGVIAAMTLKKHAQPNGVIGHSTPRVHVLKIGDLSSVEELHPPQGDWTISELLGVSSTAKVLHCTGSRRTPADGGFRYDYFVCEWSIEDGKILPVAELKEAAF